MYLTDFREYCLRDVITRLEPDLFSKVTSLTIPDFELLISIGDKLTHKTFGEDVVVSFDGHYLVCRFDFNREKKFIYPDCFEKGYFI